MTQLPRLGVRAATSDDYGVAEQLLRLAVEEAGPQRGGELLLDFDFAGQIALPEPGDRSTLLLVAALDDSIVGYLVLRNVIQGASRVAMVEQLFVHPQARAIGIGAALLEHGEQTARSWGASSLESQVLPGNRAAKNFFERMGLVTRKMRVSRPLDTD